jgi:hypothetical protein
MMGGRKRTQVMRWNDEGACHRVPSPLAGEGQGEG